MLDQGANYKAINTTNQTPSDIARQNNRSQLATFITNRHNALKSKFINLRVADFQEKERRITQLEEQCREQGLEINRFNDRLNYRGGFFNQINSRVIETTTHPLSFVAMLFVAAVLVFSNKENFTDNQKLSGIILGFFGFMLLAFNMLKIGKNISGAFSQVHERVIANLDSSQKAIDVISSSANKTLETFRDELRGLSGTTQTVMVQLKDETKNTLVALSGTANKVATAIEKGIEKKRFKPEAHVVANVDVRVASGNSCLVM